MNLLRRRVTAFLIDMLLVSFLLTCLSNLNYLNPYKYKYHEINEQYSEVYNELSKSILSNGSNADPQDYVEILAPYIYKVTKYSMYLYIIYLVLFFLYFVLFAYFNNSQTLGKKLCKIGIKSSDGSDVTFIKMFIRSLFNGSSLLIGVNFILIIKLILLVIKNPLTYYKMTAIINFISIVFEISFAIIMILKKGEFGLNDKISKTKIVDLK